MSAMLKDRASRYVRDAAHAFRAAPVEVALAVLAAIGCSYAIESKGTAFRSFSELASAIGVAFVFAWTATLLHALHAINEKVRWGVTIAGGLLAALYFALVIDFELGAERWRAFLLLTGGVAIVLAAPSYGRTGDDPNLLLRRVNGRFLLRVIGIGLYGLALWGGLALALGAVDTLFELDLRDTIYAHVFAWIMFTLVPWVIVGGLRDYVRSLDQTSDVARVVHRLVGFLVPPLLAVYYVILYAYAIRIITMGELPKNLVSPMVIAAGVLGALALLFFYDRNAHRVLRLAPPLFLPLTVMGFWALAPRIEQYGWTEFRVARVAVLVALTLLAVAATWWILRGRTLSLRVILLVLGVTAGLSAIGPWSALAISRRSQQSRLRSALLDAGVRPEAASIAPGIERQVPNAIYDRVDNTARYLVDHFGTGSVRDLLPASARTESALRNLATHFKLRRSQPSETEAYQSGRWAETAIQIAPGLTGYRITLLNRRDQPSGIAADSAMLGVVFPSQLFVVDLRPLLPELAPPRTQPPGLSERAVRLPVIDSAGQRRGWMLVLEADTRRVDGRLQLTNFAGILLIDGPAPGGTPTFGLRPR